MKTPGLGVFISDDGGAWTNAPGFDKWAGQPIGTAAGCPRTALARAMEGPGPSHRFGQVFGSIGLRASGRRYAVATVRPVVFDPDDATACFSLHSTHSRCAAVSSGGIFSARKSMNTRTAGSSPRREA